MKRYRKEQSRSRFAMVRRKMNEKGNLLPWCAEVRRPKEIGGGEVMINSLDTDVEAAVVASVVVGIFEKALKDKRDPSKRKGKRSKPPLQCHTYLIPLNESPLPNPLHKKSIKKFALDCAENYKEIVKAVEEKTKPMPDDKAMADAITLYRSAIRYDQKYKEGEVPPMKQARPGENKQKHKEGEVPPKKHARPGENKRKLKEGEVPPKKQARPGENKRKRKRNYVENDHAGDAANPYPRRDAANP